MIRLLLRFVKVYRTGRDPEAPEREQKYGQVLVSEQLERRLAEYREMNGTDRGQTTR